MSGQPQDVRDWSTGIFGCCSDCVTCLCGYFCACCLMCEVARKADECCCLIHLCPVGGVPLRTKIRTKYGIKGSICGDYMCWFCCPLLTLCQMDRELKHVGV